MTDLRRRLDALPAGLRDGAWAHCSLRATATRLYVDEAADTVTQRRQAGLRRRALMAVVMLILLAIVPTLSQPGQVALGIAASLLGMAVLDGLRGDLRSGSRPRQYAILDISAGELALLRAGGGGVAIPLDRLKMILVVLDPAHRICHLGVVVEEESLYLPWIHTRSISAASTLAWLLGYFTDRPVGQLESPLPPLPEAIGQAAPIARPSQPSETE